MFQEILKRSKEEIKIVNIRLIGDSDSFFCGYVKDFNENFIIMQHFTKYGKHDGLMIEKLDSIESIEFDDDYTRAMAYIIENNILLDLEENIHVNFAYSDNWAYGMLKPHVNKPNLIISIQVNKDAFYTGLIQEINENYIRMNLIGKDGQDDGISVYKLEDVTSLRLNDLEDRRKLILFRWRSRNK